MSLIADIKKLRELEQKATPEKWNNVPRNEHGTITRDDAKFIFEVRNLAPAMLGVLGMFRAGDAEMLRWILAETIDNGSEIRAMIERFKQMAERMEQEES